MLALGVVGAILTVLLVGVLVGGAVVAAHRARAAADLGALAGAGRLLAAADPAEACRAAAAVAADNGGAVTECVAEGLEVRLEATAPVPAGLALLGPARARARAGPPPPG